MKYGIFFSTYKGQRFDMWVFSGDNRLERDNPEHHDLQIELNSLRNRNPMGEYNVRQILD